MRQRYLKKIGVSAFAFTLGLNVFAFDLTDQGKLPMIVLPEKPHGSSVLAAEELAEYVQKVSGSRLSIVGEKDAGKGPLIRIGTLDTMKNLPADAAKQLKDRKIEASYISVNGDEIFIVGKSRVGELYGTYRFIKKYLGVRWLKPAEPGDSGEYIPGKSKITVPDGVYMEEPYFQHRQFTLTGAFNSVLPKESIKWNVRNGGQEANAYSNIISKADRDFLYDRISDVLYHMYGGHQTFQIPINRSLKTTGKDHPEYFALVDGKRYRSRQMPQYCLSNPAVQKLVTDDILQYIEKTGVDKADYLFGMADSAATWCECEECQKLDAPGETKGNSISTRFHTVAEKIAQEVYRKYPTAKIRFWAYHTYLNIPHGIRHDKRSELYYCNHGRCYAHRLDDPSCIRNVQHWKRMKEWLGISSRLYVYDYFTCTPSLYIPNELFQAEEIKLYKKLGLTGWQTEASWYDSKRVKKRQSSLDMFPSIWQWLYVTNELLWDPDLDVNKVIAEAESCYYGKAYGPMKKYHDLRRKLWQNGQNCMGYPTNDQRRPTLLNMPEAKDKLLKYLAEAEKLAEGDAVLARRIAMDKRFLQEYWIKPNEELKARKGSALRATEAKGTIIIDGDGNESAWMGASYVKDFRKAFDQNRPAIPAERETRVGVLCDAENLYFLITAMEPNPEKMKIKAAMRDGETWGDDGIELFLYPQGADNAYYQLAVNPNGVVFDQRQPGGDVAYDLKAEVKTKILKDRYVVEIKIPAKRLGEFNRGKIWKFHVVRNIYLGNQKGVSYSIDGVPHHDFINYRALEIGSPYVRNGSFDKAKNGLPEHWVIQRADYVQKGKGSYAVRLNKRGVCYQCLVSKELAQQNSIRKIRVSFLASGNGTLYVNSYNYHDEKDHHEKYGYKRYYRGTRSAGKFKVEKKPKAYQVDITILPDEFAAVAFSTREDTVEIDDVAVTLLSVDKK